MRFAFLTFLALLFSLAGGVLTVIQFEKTLPEFMGTVVDTLGPYGQSVWVLIAANILPALLIVWAYVSSFRLRKPRRPTFGLYVLGLSLWWLLLGWSVTFLGADVFFEIPVAAGAGAAVLVLACSIRWVEILIGKICLGLGDLFLKREMWQSAAKMLGMARRFLPANDQAARKQGLALYELGEAEQALAILVEAYQRGERDPRLVRTLAESAFSLDDALAGSVLAEMLKLDPNNAKVGRRLVELHLRHNRPAEALPVLEKFYDSNNIEDVCLLGRLNAEQGNVDRALQLSRRAMDLEGPPYRRTLADLQVLTMQAPDNPAVLLTLADLNERIKNREEAVSWYLNLLEVQPENLDARRRLIRLYREMGRLDQAMPHYRALLRQEPDSVDVVLEYGQLLEDRQDFEKAYKVFQDFAARHPQDPRIAYHCAVSLFGMGRLSEAIETLERVRAEAPASERARIQSLLTKIQTAQVELELEAMRQQAHKEDAPLDLRLAYVERLVAAGQAEQATRELDVLLEQHPKEKRRVVEFIEGILERGGQQFVLLNLLADICLKDRDFDRCHRLYEMMSRQSLHPDEILADGCRQILRQNPNHLPALRSHALLLIKGGHHREGARVLAKILEISPPARDELVPQLFEVYYQLGDADRAIPYGEELLARDAQNLSLYLRLHELYVKREDYVGAIRILQSALRIAPDNRQLQEMLEEAETRVKENRLDAIKAQLEAEPDQPALLHEMGDLQVNFGRLNEAITAYQRAAQQAEGNLRQLCLIKLSHCLCNKMMYDLADETLREVDVREKDPEHLDAIKQYLYEVGHLFEQDEQYDRALQIYKKLFKIDAGYRDIVGRIEDLSHLAR